MFRKKLTIHIRKYKKYGQTNYPSTDGITMQPEQFNVLCSINVPSSVLDIIDLNLRLDSLNPLCEPDFYCIMNDENSFTISHNFTCRSGRVYKSSVLINSLQWEKLKELRDAVYTSFISLKFRAVNFSEVFKLVSRCPVKERVPDELDYSASMRSSLRYVLHRHIESKKGLTLTLPRDEEPEPEDIPTIADFNESCMSLNVVSVILDFEKELKTTKVSSSKIPLAECMNEQFLDSVNLEEMLLFARKEFCNLEL